MTRVAYDVRPDGSGVLWVRRPRGRWRRFTFATLDVFDRLFGRLADAALDLLPAALRLVAQVTPAPDAAVPALLPRPGPSPLAPNAP